LRSASSAPTSRNICAIASSGIGSDGCSYPFLRAHVTRISPTSLTSGSAGLVGFWVFLS
jgi:hypothetical protein